MTLTLTDGETSVLLSELSELQRVALAHAATFDVREPSRAVVDYLSSRASVLADIRAKLERRSK